jgi:hypothetical protein
VYTKLDFNTYETDVRTPLTKLKTLYVNLNLDVHYLGNSPWVSNIELVRAFYLTNYTPFRNLRVDTRRYNGGVQDWIDEARPVNNMILSDTFLLQSRISSLLKQAWYFPSTVERVKLIADEN